MKIHYVRIHTKGNIVRDIYRYLMVKRLSHPILLSDTVHSVCPGAGRGAGQGNPPSQGPGQGHDLQDPAPGDGVDGSEDGQPEVGAGEGCGEDEPDEAAGSARQPAEGARHASQNAAQTAEGKPEGEDHQQKTQTVFLKPAGRPSEADARLKLGPQELQQTSQSSF